MSTAEKKSDGGGKAPLGGMGKPAGTAAAQPTSAQANRAALTLQSVFRGAAARNRTALAMQAITPYASRTQYHMATHNYSIAARKRSQALKNAEWGVYDSTRRIAATEQPAFLHSFQKVDDFKGELQARGTSRFELTGEGNVYEPGSYGGRGVHDMRSNAAWMLGLAHHGAPAVMTTALTDQTLVRQSAQGKDAKEANTENAFSALGREVLGMVQHGTFAPVAGPRNKQVLTPSADAKRATLSTFQTPRGLPTAQIKSALQAKGIDVSGIK